MVADFDRKPKGVTHPPTPIAQTGRGHHVYLRSDRPAKTQTFPWGELRGNDSYVVLPDSVHPTGKPYFYVVSPNDVAVASLSDLRFTTTPVVESNEYTPTGDQGTEYKLPEYPSEGPFEELAKYEEPVRRAVRALGIDQRLGGAFRCILPGHAEQKPSASIYPHPHTGVYLYRDWHAREGFSWLPLSWVRAAIGYGRVCRLKSPESSRWYLRLFYEAGVLEPMPVDLPRLSANTRDSVVKAAEGFRLLLGLRWLREPGTPAPFTRSFAAPWCELGERAAGEAITELRELGIIQKVDEHRAGCKTTCLFMPGDGQQRPRGAR